MNTRIALGLLTLIRALFICLIVFGLEKFLGLVSNQFLIYLSIFIGTSLGTWLFVKKLKLKALLAISFVSILLYNLLFYLSEVIIAPTEKVFSIYVVFQHLDLITLVFLISLLSTFLYWRYPTIAALEAILVLVFISLIFSAHRNYQLDFYRLINDISWDTGYSHLVIISAIGFTTYILFLAYFLLSNAIKFNRDTYTLTFTKIQTNFPAKLLNVFVILLLVSATYYLTKQIYSYHDKQSRTALMNGVGSTDEGEVSPLDFRSALGSSNQPAALVRLNNDYINNPHSPMLYIRESALSEIHKFALAIAPDKFNMDIPRTSIHQVYKRKSDYSLPQRVEIDHSVYLLSDHKIAFAIDYPISINPLRLSQNTKRFKNAYRAVSMAPDYSFKDLAGRHVGGANWSEEQWKHFTKKHPDKRYQEFSDKIVEGAYNDLHKAVLIADYLSKNIIYTLTPNHEYEDNEDPTATMLFGDLRGYCVHIAHAAVYLMRAQGIPSRIGTGYLTDYSQAKDGHILLRMSDRHSWAEIYINEAGWVPFDSTPEQVESHAETPVDQETLDDLIDMLGTDEEIISDELLKGELVDEEKGALHFDLPELSFWLRLLVLLLVILYVRKYHLMYAWTLPGSDSLRLKRLYLALLSIFNDLGFEKKAGETKEEYLRKMSKEFNWNNLDIADQLNNFIYSLKAQDLKDFDYDSVFHGLRRELSWRQKLSAYLNLKSTMEGIGLWKF